MFYILIFLNHHAKFLGQHFYSDGLHFRDLKYLFKKLKHVYRNLNSQGVANKLPLKAPVFKQFKEKKEEISSF